MVQMTAICWHRQISEHARRKDIQEIQEERARGKRKKELRAQRERVRPSRTQMTASALLLLPRLVLQNDFLAWRAVARGKKVKSIGKAYPGELKLKNKKKKKKKKWANGTFLLHQSFSQSSSLASLSLIHAFMRTPPSTSSAAAYVCAVSEHTCTTDAISALSLSTLCTNGLP